MRRDCECEAPQDHREFHAGFRDGWCRYCGGFLNPDWLTSTEGLQAFLDAALVDPVTAAHCHVREQAGRDEFGLAYLSRNNPAEGREEAVDGCNYAYFESLKDRRVGSRDLDFDLLDAARHFALAHQALVRAGARRGDRG